MRAFLRRGLLCVAAGALTALAVAWAAAWWRPLPRDASMFVARDSSGEAWMGPGERGLGWSALTLYGATGLTSAGQSIAKPLPGWIDLPREGSLESRAVTVVGAGWPLICLRAEIVGVGHEDPPPGGAWHSGLGPQWVEWGSWRGALGNPAPLIGSLFRQRILPCEVLPLRFAGNVALWSIVWALPLMVLSLRRVIWRHRGHCPACGYDLQHAFGAGCSECGWRREHAARSI